MREKLADVLSLFIERYHLQETDDSAGRDAIRAAMRGDLSIPALRRILTEDYELYPQYKGRVLAILDAIEEEPEAVAAPSDDEDVASEPGVPADGEDATTTEEEPEAPRPIRRATRNRPR